jgi:hypothetical protein
MAFIPVPNVAQITLEGIVDRQETINDLYFEVSGGGINPTNLFSITSAVATWWLGNLVPLLSRDWASSRVRGRDLTLANGSVAELSAGNIGGVDQEAAPNNVAACIKLRTSVAGRSFRGRNYIPGVPNNLITLNTLDNTFMNDVETAYNLLTGAGTFLAGWQMVVVSRFTGGSPGVPSHARAAGIATPVTSCLFASPYVRSMRSREIGHGK